MSETYKQKEYELKSAIDSINSIPYIFEDYLKETNDYIDRLLEETKEINVLRNIIKEIKLQLDYLETYSSKEDVYEDMARRLNNREHFIATLQACYFGDRNAFNEIVRIYDEKENIIKEVREKIESVQILGLGLRSGKTFIAALLNDILEILDKGDSNEC